jgi:hypothetical protein
VSHHSFTYNLIQDTKRFDSLWGGTQPLSKWQSLCGFAGKKGKSEADKSELNLPAPDPQVLEEMVNARGNSNVSPIPHDTDHAGLNEAGVVGTASDVADSNNRSHFSDIYFDNEDDFQNAGVDDEHKLTDQEFTMLDHYQDGDLPRSDQQLEPTNVEEVD